MKDIRSSRVAIGGPLRFEASFLALLCFPMTSRGAKMVSSRSARRFTPAGFLLALRLLQMNCRADSVTANAPGWACVLRTFRDVGAFILIAVDPSRRLSPLRNAVREDLVQARFGARRVEVHQAMRDALAAEGCWQADRGVNRSMPPANLVDYHPEVGRQQGVSAPFSELHSGHGAPAAPQPHANRPSMAGADGSRKPTRYLCR
jgi:hypothetical protein